MGMRSARTLAYTGTLAVSLLLLSPAAAFADASPAPAANISSAGPAAVAAAPVAPQNVQWAKADKDHAKLSWQPSPTAPQGSTPHYSLKVTFDSGDPYSVESTTETSALVPVSPGVSASATVTDIEQSATAESPKWTQPAVTPESAQEVNLTARDMNYANKPPAVRVVWTAPKADGGSEITGYLVQLLAGEGSKRQLVDSSTTGSNTFSHTFSNLEFETHYVVQVTSKNKVGAGEKATSNAVETVAEPEASTSSEPVSTPSQSSSEPAPSPSASASESSAPVIIQQTPSPTPSAGATSSQLLFATLVPIIILLLIAAVVALVFVLRYNKRVDEANRRWKEAHRDDIV